MEGMLRLVYEAFAMPVLSWPIRVNKVANKRRNTYWNTMLEFCLSENPNVLLMSLMQFGSYA